MVTVAEKSLMDHQWWSTFKISFKGNKIFHKKNIVNQSWFHLRSNSVIFVRITILKLCQTKNYLGPHLDLTHGIQKFHYFTLIPTKKNWIYYWQLKIIDYLDWTSQGSFLDIAWDGMKIWESHLLNWPVSCNYQMLMVIRCQCSVVNIGQLLTVISLKRSVVL